MVAGVCMVRWIPPEDIGLWQSVRLASVYAIFALAGIVNGLSRELPYHMGKADDQTSRRLASTALMYVLGACFVALMGGAGSLMVLRGLESKAQFAVAAVTLSIIFSFYTNYLIVTFRSSSSFQNLTKAKVAEGLCGLATIPLLYYLGYNGMLTRVIFMGGIVLLLMHLMRPIHVSPSWDRRSFLLLLSTGAPIFIFDYLSNSSATCDRLVLLRLGGVKAVGYYSMALLAREAIAVIPGALSEYVYPRMSYAYGEHANPLHLWKMALKSSLLAVVIMVPVATAGWFLMPPVVSTLFPKYTEAINAAQLLLVSAVFTGATVGRSAIWSMKAWKLMAWYQLLGAGFLIAGPLVGGMAFSPPLLGVSVGLLVGQALWCPIAWWLIHYATHRRDSL